MIPATLTVEMTKMSKQKIVAKRKSYCKFYDLPCKSEECPSFEKDKLISSYMYPTGPIPMDWCNKYNDRISTVITIRSINE